ncbi:M42 family metallopeptidase [Tumebacillus sp. ITR2]|uniref:M42 family metallopeptidase n=1 Tax=Tumebacillus amylolyticus TaxID=2801339 RepID=A0ABS1JCL8_9BACL|nr:M42 family metallopeptidase [Tumebacillus amylolyticus]MBL0387965.1 M42 family metallopeptidase [Tumebacillus amylolyticus]
MLLKRLTEAVGPSGFEDEIRQVIYEEIKDHVDHVYTDVLGNLIAEKHGTRPGPKVMLCAHMDEVSLMIAAIDHDGMIQFRHIGGIDDRILVAKPVLIGPNQISGVIGSKPAHHQSGEERRRPIPLDELRIDIGASTREEALRYVKPGDIAVFATKYEEIGVRRAKSKSFDDRVGCAVMVETLKKNFDIPVVFAFAVQEEIGLRGAGPLAYRIQPDISLVLEGTLASDIPGTVAHGRATELGKGPALSLMDSSSVHNRKFIDHMVQVAENSGIPYQFRNTIAGGNDSGRIHISRTGVLAGVVSVPTRYIHAPSQMISLDDYENTILLVEKFLRSVEQGGLTS